MAEPWISQADPAEWQLSFRAKGDPTTEEDCQRDTVWGRQGKGHEIRNAGGLQKPEKARKRMLSEASRGNKVLPAP